MVSSAICLHIITDLPAFKALQVEWDALAAATEDCFLSQTFEWAIFGWEKVAQPRRRRLACLVGRLNGELVLVWPFTISRSGPWRIAQPLGSESSEYTAPLVIATGGQERLIGAAWEHLTNRLPVDVILLPHVRRNSPLDRVLADTGGRQAVETQPAPFVAWCHAGHWPHYYAGLSSQLRGGIRRKRRRLGQRGLLTFETLIDPDEAAAAISWMLKHKRGWLNRTGRRNNWIDTGEYLAFLVAMLNRTTAAGRLVIEALKVDQQLIAAELSAIDRTRVEWFIGAFDPDWASYSPGQLLQEHCLRQACEAGLEYDFRIGDEAYKQQWCNHTIDVATVHCALSAVGLAYVYTLEIRYALKRLRRYLRHRIPPKWRRLLKQMLQIKR